MLIDGIHVPMTVPFYRDGRLYVRKLEHNAGRYSLGPVSGLIVLPPGGEAATLSDQETAELLQAAAASTLREKVLVAGIARDSVFTALEWAEKANSAGFDALLLSPPGDWRALTAGELSLYFRAVADGATLPVLLWSDPDGLELPVEAVAELAQHPNIIGLYDAGLTSSRYAALAAATEAIRRDVQVTSVFAPVTRRMLVEEREGAATFVSAESLGGGAAVAVAPPKPAVKTRTKTVGFQIMAAGAAANMLELLQAGAAGAMPRLAACAPQATHEVLAAFKDGDPALSAEKAARLEAADRLMQELGIPGIKHGCDLNGYFGGQPRLPRLPLAAEDRARVETVLRELRN